MKGAHEAVVASAPAPGPDADRIQRLASWATGWPLTAFLCVLLLFTLAQWLPHYLFWPNSPDIDAFATLALGWKSGQMLPYRDLPSYQFPGQIYLFWLAGWLGGWTNTVGVHALDAVLLLALGAAMTCWSRACFGRALPGLVGYAGVLGIYLNLPYELVAQREWHTGIFGCFALMFLEAPGGRWGRSASAMAMAAAVMVRPQGMLFLPAILLAIDETARAPGESLRNSAGPIIAWCLTFAAAVGLMLAPLWLSGLWTHFLDGFRQVLPGGPFTRMAGKSDWRVERRVYIHLRLVRTWVLPVLLYLLTRHLSPRLRRATFTWIVALLSVTLYLYLTPVFMSYTDQAILLVCAFGLALLAAAVLESRGVAPELRLSAVLLLTLIGLPQCPTFCLMTPTLRALDGTLTFPPGYSSPPGIPAYTWTDLSATLAYIRDHTTPDTRVGNLLFFVPAINSPTGRLPAYPWNSLSLYRIFRRPEVWDKTRAALEADPEGTVVVWSPPEFETDPAAASTLDVVRRLYKREAQFGDIQVWRKTGGPALPALQPLGPS